MEKIKRPSYYNAEHQKKYRDNVKSIRVGFNQTKKEDAELFEHLQTVGDKTTYIKTLIRKDMEA